MTLSFAYCHFSLRVTTLYSTLHFPPPLPAPSPFPLAPDAFVKQAGEAVNKTLWDKSDTGS